ncbi:MAG TPA: HAD family phosphatase [Candidatus Fimicola cottocaccae]|nr:HAD family phosphatase [Candidatus Fimicola cottocaccae]
MVLKADYFIFDMDGLLIDSEMLVYKIWDKILTDKGYNLDIEFYKESIGIPDENMKYRFLEVYGNDFNFEKFTEEYIKMRDDIYNNEGVPLKYGLVELLDKLKNKNKTLAVATSSKRAVVEKILSKNNILKYFDYFITCDDVTKHKPEPEVFLKALEIGGFKAENSFVLEDSENGLKAAHGAGIRSIFIKDMVEPKKEVLDTVYYRGENLFEISKIVE